VFPRTMSRRAFVGTVVATPLATQLAMADVPDEEVAPARSQNGTKEHVIVIGAGAFGGWSALALLRAGKRVTLIDAWGAGNSRASSGGETRVIRAVYGGNALYSKMAVRALTLWRAAEKQWKRQVFFHTGALWSCAADDGYVRRSIEPMKAAGVALEQVSLDDAARRWPQVNFRDVRSVFFEPEAGFLTARAACELVRETFVREGGTYRQAEVRPVASDAARLPGITLSDGSTLAADKYVFACGPWLPQLFPDVIGHRIVPTRQEVFFFGTPAGNTQYDRTSLPVWVHIGERFVYGMPDHDRRGLKVADDTAGPEVDPTTLEREPSADGLARARAILRDRFPAMAGAPLLEARVCQYEASSDGNYLVDRHPQLDNVWLVGGGSGHGYKMGPALGEHVAALVQGRAAVHPLFAYGTKTAGGRR
jgi:glycine/D-amino acid oxidase-like deaminating enzyme